MGTGKGAGTGTAGDPDAVEDPEPLPSRSPSSEAPSLLTSTADSEDSGGSEAWREPPDAERPGGEGAKVEGSSSSMSSISCGIASKETASAGDSSCSNSRNIGPCPGWAGAVGAGGADVEGSEGAAAWSSAAAEGPASEKLSTGGGHFGQLSRAFSPAAAQGSMEPGRPMVKLGSPPAELKGAAGGAGAAEGWDCSARTAAGADDGGGTAGSSLWFKPWRKRDKREFALFEFLDLDQRGPRVKVSMIALC